MKDILDSELREIEAQLENLSPNRMPDDMLIRMEQAMMSWEAHLPVEEKIVPFNNTSLNYPTTPSSTNPNESKLHTWGIAAAIALIASLAAVFMTPNSSETHVITANSKAESSKPSSNITAVNSSTPGLSRNITHASNEGITYAGKDEAPFKVLRIEYTEKITTHDKNGNPVVTNKPCVEHILIPVPIH